MCRSFLAFVCMFTVSKALFISRATVIELMTYHLLIFFSDILYYLFSSLL